MSASVRSLFYTTTWLALLLAFASMPLRAQTNATCTFKLFTLNASNNPDFQPNGINDYGTVVGQAITSPTKGFIRYSGGGVSYFAAPNSASTSFLARNDNGTNVGSYSTQGTSSNIGKGFVLQGSTFTSVVHPKAVWGTILTGINKYNSSVGWYLDSGEFAHGFKRFSNGGLAGLDFPGGHDTQPAGINDSGTVVGSFADFAGEHGFIYHGGTWAKIDYPGPQGTTQVRGISNGNMVVGISTSQEPYIPFIYVNGVFKVIAVPNASFTLVNGIAPGGMITGTTVPNGTNTNQGFIATCK